MLPLKNPNEGNSFIFITYLVVTVHKPEKETPNIALLIRFWNII